MNIASLLQARENRTLKRTIRKNKSVLSVVCRKIIRINTASFEFFTARNRESQSLGMSMVKVIPYV